MVYSFVWYWGQNSGQNSGFIALASASPFWSRGQNFDLIWPSGQYFSFTKPQGLGLGNEADTLICNTDADTTTLRQASKANLLYCSCSTLGQISQKESMKQDFYRSGALLIANWQCLSTERKSRRQAGRRTPLPECCTHRRTNKSKT